MKKLIFLQIIITISSLTYSQWVLDSNGIGNKYIYSLTNNGNNIFAGSYHYISPYSGVYLSTNNGSNWTQAGLINLNVWSLTVKGNNIFAGTQGNGGGLYLSTDNGSSWTNTSLYQWVYSLAVNENTIFAGVRDNGVFLSTNNGTNWTQTSLNNRWVYSLAVNGDYVFAGTISYGVYLSSNNGTNWTQTSFYNGEVLSLAVNGNNIFAGSYGVFFSTNNGTSWNPAGLSNQWVLSLAVNGNYVFAGTLNAGFYSSSDNGANWILKNEGIICNEVRALCMSNNYIFAGTDSSVYRRPLFELVGINPISSNEPIQFNLYQNYPNPFNPTTKIKFYIPLSRGVPEGRGMSTKLIIYDILSREVTTLVNENLSPGTYEIEWNGSNFPSGVYFYKLETENYSNTKKLILLK